MGAVRGLPGSFRAANLKGLLSKIDFVDFILFGKWNYDKRANDREFYREMVKRFQNWCEKAGMRCYVKSETLKFCEPALASRSEYC